MFYLLNYKIWGTLQDQNQGRPRATRTQCGRMDQRIIDKVVREWRKVDKKANLRENW